MSNERRQPGARVPFEALVEIAAPEGTSFEAESVDLSASGMHLRTAYLPKVGTALSFRFEPNEAGAPVIVKGEVVWSQDGDGGCEFGVRFDDLAAGDAEMIQKIVSVTTETVVSPLQPGAPMRIHIEGMSAPMRAVLRTDQRSNASVGVELKTLRLGALVELEDKDKRTRRPARVDGVECEIDPGTRVPQLVVKLRYDELDANLPYLPTKKVPMPADVEIAAKEARTALTPEPPAEPETKLETGAQQRVALPVAHEPEGRLDTMKEGMRTVGEKMKDAFSGAAFAASKLGARVGTTVALLTKKKSDGSGDEGEGRRATSAFAGLGSKPRTLRPQGASRDFIHSGDSQEENAMQEIDSKKIARRRQIGIAAGVGVAAMLGFLAFRKPAAHPPVVQAPAPELAPMAAAPPPAPAPAPMPADTAASIATPAPALVGESTGLDAKGNPNPFGTTAVKKGTKMVLRLDGPVTEIKGMQMPNGFVVSVPNRKSLEAAGPLAAKDPRIGSAKVVNQPGGAELTIAFKDTATAPYLVKAKGDSIEIILGHEKAIAKKKNKGGAHPAKAPAKHK